MEQARRGRAQRVALASAVVLAAGTAGYVLGSVVAGFAVPRIALIVALAASWLCIAAMAAFPRIVEVRADWGRADREIDHVSGLPRYEPALDDVILSRTGEVQGAVLVVEVVDHVSAAAIHVGAADALLADAAERISSIAASYGGTTRRLHGPQLAVLVPGLEESALTALATMLHDGASRAGAAPGSLQPGRLVVGVAVADHPRADVSGLIRSATAAATQAKRLATEVPVFFHDRLAEEARERLAVGRALRTAIDERDIDLAYQPQLDLVDGSLLGVEVLARWHDPVLGPISPNRFVQVAAEMGLSRQLDRLIFEKALSQLADWDAAGVRVPRICVNVTPETIAEGRPIGLEALLTTYGVAPERVTVELMDNRLLAGEDGVAAVQRYRDLGLKVSLDDFGSGQSSFSQLVSLPVTGLKIDRSLLSDHDADASVLGAIIQAGTALGLAVAAVGIESVEQRDLLLRLGCVVGQGYLFSRPLAGAELVDWLRTPHPVA